MNTLEARINEYLDAFEKFAQQAGPQATDFALAVTRWESLGWIVFGWVSLVGGILLVRMALREAQKGYKDARDHIVIGGGAVGTIALLFAIYPVLNPWFYIGVARPELKLARDVLGKFL